MRRQNLASHGDPPGSGVNHLAHALNGDASDRDRWNGYRPCNAAKPFDASTRLIRLAAGIKDMTSYHKVRAILLRASRSINIVNGTSNEHLIRHDMPRVRDGQRMLSKLHATTFNEERHVNTIVNEQPHTVVQTDRRRNIPRQIHDLTARRSRKAHVHRVDPTSDGLSSDGGIVLGGKHAIQRTDQV